MRVLLVRHASTGDGDELSAEGRKETQALAIQLRRLQAVPRVIVTSSSGDAQQTARVLRDELGLLEDPASVLDALRPPGRQDWFDELLDELEPMVSEDTVAIVGNEPRLSLIVAESTGRRSRPLVRTEAVSITGEDLLQYRRGQAAVEFRTALKGEPEEVLRDKLHSKTAVTTLLAGFTFAGLVEVLTGGPLSGFEAAAMVLLTLSLGLLVACIYVYDQLALPAGFWSAAERSIGKESGLRARLLGPLERFGHRFRMWTSGRAERRRAGFVFLHALRNHGVVYSYMVWTWTWIFTPAVVAGLAGFILLLVATERTSIILGGIAAIAFAAGLYLVVRPRLGTD
jgi:phosphohistidine phosphatase SixA